MKNQVDNKSHQDMRKAVIVAYVQQSGFIRRFMPGKTEIIVKKHHQVVR
jgi:hypothetical protein